MIEDSTLPPMLAMICWSMVMFLWLYATRIPAMKQAGISPQAAETPGALDVLPAWARRPADNYNHLFEQPTVFYALAIYVHLAGHADALNVGLAWLYVLLRVLHSLVQATVNVVVVRFALFSLSGLVLLAMTVREAARLFFGVSLP